MTCTCNFVDTFETSTDMEASFESVVEVKVPTHNAVFSDDGRHGEVVVTGLPIVDLGPGNPSIGG